MKRRNGKFSIRLKYTKCDQTHYTISIEWMRFKFELMTILQGYSCKRVIRSIELVHVEARILVIDNHATDKKRDNHKRGIYVAQ